MPPKFSCKICMKRFSRESALEDHLNSDSHKEMVKKKEEAKKEDVKRKLDQRRSA